MPAIDEQSLMLFLCRPGTLLDIGANHGQYTQCLLSVPGSRVIAFEPVIESFTLLSLNLMKIGGGKLPQNAVIYNVALGAEAGVAQITNPFFRGGTSYQAASLTVDFEELYRDAPEVGLSLSRQDTLVVPLDLLRFTDVRFMKIDVEGFEKEVLRGAYDTISRDRPILYVEIFEHHRKGATSEVPALLASMNYRGFFILGDRLHEICDFNPSAMQLPPPLPGSGMPYPDPFVVNFVFVHNEDRWGLTRIAELASFLITPTPAATDR